MTDAEYEQARHALAGLMVLAEDPPRDGRGRLDSEATHSLRDRFVLEFLRAIAPQVADAAEAVERAVPFHYA